MNIKDFKSPQKIRKLLKSFSEYELHAVLIQELGGLEKSLDVYLECGHTIIPSFHTAIVLIDNRIQAVSEPEIFKHGRYISQLVSFMGKREFKIQTNYVPSNSNKKAKPDFSKASYLSQIALFQYKPSTVVSSDKNTVKNPSVDSKGISKHTIYPGIDLIASFETNCQLFDLAKRHNPPLLEMTRGKGKPRGSLAKGTRINSLEVTKDLSNQCSNLRIQWTGLSDHCCFILTFTL